MFRVGSSGTRVRRIRAASKSTIRVLTEEAEHVPSGSPEDHSFEWKLDLLGSLIASTGSRLRFNVGDFDASEVSAQLIQLLTRANELYLQTVDPMLLRLHLRGEFREKLPTRIMDAADYVTYADWQLDEFFLVSDLGSGSNS